MKKKQPLPQTNFTDLAKEIDEQLSAREVAVFQIEEELNDRSDVLKHQELQLSTDRESFEKEKADFNVLRQEVDSKYSQIRSDVKLTEDLKEQADQAKEIEKNLKEINEERMLSEYNLEQVAKRETALSEREKEYKSEIEKQFVGGFFKGK